MPHPVCIALTFSPPGGGAPRTTYARLGEQTPATVAGNLVVPDWVLRNLGAPDMCRLAVSQALLPKLTHMRVRPMARSGDFRGHYADVDSQVSFLTAGLEQNSVAVVGQVLRVGQYLFKVLQLRAEKANPHFAAHAVPAASSGGEGEGEGGSGSPMPADMGSVAAGSLFDGQQKVDWLTFDIAEGEEPEEDGGVHAHHQGGEGGGASPPRPTWHPPVALPPRHAHQAGGGHGAPGVARATPATRHPGRPQWRAPGAHLQG